MNTWILNTHQIAPAFARVGQHQHQLGYGNVSDTRPPAKSSILGVYTPSITDDANVSRTFTFYSNALSPSTSSSDLCMPSLIQLPLPQRERIRQRYKTMHYLHRVPMPFKDPRRK